MSIQTSGRSRSDAAQVEWALPEWGAGAYRLCSVGLHISTRRRVVWGWVGFSEVERYYCACGRHCWITFEGHFVNHDVSEPGGHLEWIEEKVQLDQTMDLHRKRELREQMWPKT